MCNKIGYGTATRLIHHGYAPDPVTGAISSPIYQTANFAASSVEEFNLKCQQWGYIYSRETNPNLTELEQKLVMLEEGESALTCASGMGAISSTMLSLLNSGDHIICSDGIFSHTKLLIDTLAEKFNIDVTGYVVLLYC